MQICENVEYEIVRLAMSMKYKDGGRLIAWNVGT